MKLHTIAMLSHCGNNSQISFKSLHNNLYFSTNRFGLQGTFTHISVASIQGLFMYLTKQSFLLTPMNAKNLL